MNRRKLKPGEIYVIEIPGCLPVPVTVAKVRGDGVILDVPEGLTATGGVDAPVKPPAAFDAADREQLEQEPIQDEGAIEAKLFEHGLAARKGSAA